MVEGDSADFNGSEAQGVGQVDRGIRPDIPRKSGFRGIHHGDRMQPHQNISL